MKVYSTMADKFSNGAAALGPPIETKGAKRDLDTDAFLKLLTAQLQFQDPLQPLSGEQMLAQISQLTTVGELLKLNQNYKAMAAVQAVTGAAQLLGRRLEWTDVRTGDTKAGTVTRIQMGQRGWELVCGDVTVSWDTIISVQ